MIVGQAVASDERRAMPVDTDAEKAPPLVERFVRQLVVANKAVMLYPPGSHIPLENATAALTALEEAIAEHPDLTLVVTKQGLYFGETPIFSGQPTFTAFSQELYNRRISLVRFHAGATADDLIEFLSLMKTPPEDLAGAGGCAAFLWEAGVTAITVVETQVTLIDQAPPDELGEDGGEAHVATVQKRSNKPRTRERIEITRVFGNERSVREYLTQRVDERGRPIPLSTTQKRFSELAEMADEATGERSDATVRMFAKALWAIDPMMRAELLDSQLLPSARNSPALANTIKRIDLEEMIRLLAERESEFDSRRTGFTRALRNLAQITGASRTAVTGAASGVLGEAGLSDSEIGQLVTAATPTRLTVRHVPGSQTRSMDGAANAVLRLIDHAQVADAADPARDPELAELQREAARGVGDADVVAALVSLATIDPQHERFDSAMKALEEVLDGLLDRGEIEVAAQAAKLLIDACTQPGLRPAQKQRMRDALGRLARPEEIRTLTQTLRLYADGESEHDAAHELLGTLGQLAVQPLLEQLANEPDRAERKALVDLLSETAADNIDELAAHVGDSRWYFVRNVVAILGSVKSAKVLPHLERPLVNADPRVRREAIRALSGIHERRAVELLLGSLEDEDSHNVQLAARYLGATKTRQAVAALEMVARGEGRGSRDNGPRVEAIESLGRMGAREAIPTLQAIAKKRAIIGAARARELRTAAQAAINAIKTAGYA
jgi:HEAT repeat protein